MSAQKPLSARARADIQVVRWYHNQSYGFLHSLFQTLPADIAVVCYGFNGGVRDWGGLPERARQVIRSEYERERYLYVA